MVKEMSIIYTNIGKLMKQRVMNYPNLDPINHPDEKRCTKCKEWRNLSEYYKDKKTKNGLGSHCRFCILEYQALIRVRTRIYPFEPEGMRYCSRCKLIKKESEFNLNKKGLFHRKCQECYRKDSKDYFLNHKEQVNQYRVDNWEHISLVKKEHYLLNKDYYRKKSNEWRIKNPEKSRISVNNAKAKKKDHYRLLSLISNMRRRTRLAGLPKDFTKDDWIRALNYFDNRCAVCGRKADVNMGLCLSIDHWIPTVSTNPNNKGTVIENIVPLCHTKKYIDTINIEAGCNNKKGVKEPEIWLHERYDEITADEILRRIKKYFEWAKNEKQKMIIESYKTDVKKSRNLKKKGKQNAKLDRRLILNHVLPHPYKSICIFC